MTAKSVGASSDSVKYDDEPNTEHSTHEIGDEQLEPQEDEETPNHHQDNEELLRERQEQEQLDGRDDEPEEEDQEHHQDLGDDDHHVDNCPSISGEKDQDGDYEQHEQDQRHPQQLGDEDEDVEAIQGGAIETNGEDIEMPSHAESPTTATEEKLGQGETGSGSGHSRRYSSGRDQQRHYRRSEYGHYKTEEGEDCQTLYIRNLPHDFRSEDIKNEFSQFGEIVDCRVVINPVTKDSRGFGFVQFTTVEMAEAAREKMDGKDLRGKPLRIEKARRNRPHDPTPGEYKGPTGASIKYDNRGRLKPGYVPYWTLPFPKHLHHDSRGSPVRGKPSFPSERRRFSSYRRSTSRDVPSSPMYNRHNDTRISGYSDRYSDRGMPQSRVAVGTPGGSPWGGSVRGDARSKTFYSPDHHQDQLRTPLPLSSSYDTHYHRGTSRSDHVNDLPMRGPTVSSTWSSATRATNAQDYDRGYERVYERRAGAGYPPVAVSRNAPARSRSPIPTRVYASSSSRRSPPFPMESHRSLDRYGGSNAVNQSRGPLPSEHHHRPHDSHPSSGRYNNHGGGSSMGRHYTTPHHHGGLPVSSSSSSYSKPVYDPRYPSASQVDSMKGIESSGKYPAPYHRGARMVEERYAPSGTMSSRDSRPDARLLSGSHLGHPSVDPESRYSRAGLR